MSCGSSYDLIFESGLFSQNNFDLKLTYTCNYLSFHHFVQEVNEIWYSGKAIIRLRRYQLSLISCNVQMVEWQVINYKN